jgi:xanthine dehydrogenase accessory factor
MILPLCLKHAQQDGAVALVTITSTQGSSPREVGAQMLITKSGGTVGTIGGGALEYAVIADARTALDACRRDSLVKDWPLGPDLGQCCGGRVITDIEFFYSDDISDLDARISRQAALQQRHVLLFGAGHVGRAIIMALAPLPFVVQWIDNRKNVFPHLVPQNVSISTGDDWLGEIARAPDASMALVMTYSHALDLEIVDALLRYEKFSYVGLIGSLTKRSRFEKRLSASGLSQAKIDTLICPIGLPDIYGKEPAVIAASVVADLLIRDGGLRTSPIRSFVTDQDRTLQP